MKYSILTFGCRVNQADSLGIEEELRAIGGQAAPVNTADVVVVNTCSVTASSDQSARQAVRRIARQNPDARIVVTGCYATRRPDEVARLPQVAHVVTNDEKPSLLRILLRDSKESGARGADPGSVGVGPHAVSKESGARGADPGSVGVGPHAVSKESGARGPLEKSPEERGVVGPHAVSVVGPHAVSKETTTAERFGDGDGSCGLAIEPGMAGRTAFTLRVQTGCEQPCSYCIIPSTRGVPRSIPPSEVLHEVGRVVSAGFQEVILTGVHLGSYGRDLTPAFSLLDLLVELDRAPFHTPAGGSCERLRFRVSSIEPMDCTRGIVDLVAESERLAPHFHLPIQHASNRLLALMRRPYTIEYYAGLADYLRTRIPHAAIGSDVIVGFPGETNEDFEELAAYLARSPLTHLHVFPYSDRPGTLASAMGDKVPGPVVRERSRRIREIGERLTKQFRDSQIRTVHSALTLEDGSLAVTGNYLKVRIPPGRTRNEWLHVRITGVDSGSVLTGLIERALPASVPRNGAVPPR